MDEQQRAVVQQTLEMANATMHEALEHITKLKEENATLRQLLEQPEPVQEPVGKWMGKCIEWTENPYKFKKGQSIYTTPPAQPAAWVGLTEEELYAVRVPMSPEEIARAVEAKLREKNGGAA
jgi:hypothetical protein